MPRKKASPSPGALAQRRFRERMKAMGLSPHQVFIREEHKEALSRIEQTLRLPTLPSYVYLMDNKQMAQHWTTTSLFEALAASDYVKEGRARISLEHNSEAVILIEAHDHGDLPMQMLASGSEVHVSTVLCLASSVKDRATFNEACLRLNPIYPLSNIGLGTVHGEDAYIVFGQLSALSPLASVIEEIHTLGHCATQAANELHPHIH
ncbi:YjfI family protein [Rhodanobacter sp. FW106-PBR-LB-2-11]|uniref:YjfI family protein n=1 Tax=Rhodanobacter sp. FW106-PBR-LB-2-11 TaxID=1524463 RepID=UPI0034E5E658